MKKEDIKIGDFVHYKETGVDLYVEYYMEQDGIFLGTCSDDCPDGIDYFFKADDVSKISGRYPAEL